jgi:ABC-type branched-subunit amino acid transport system permease subunit
MGTYVAYTFLELRRTGELVLPLLGLAPRVPLVDRPTVPTALVVALVVGAVVGAAVYWLVFRPVRDAPALARVVASLGILVYLQESVRLSFPPPGATVTPPSSILPEDPIRLVGTTVSANRLILAAAAVVVAVVLGVIYRRTRFGLATRAAADDEVGALLSGVNPDRAAVVNWMVAGVLGGAAVIAIEPITGVNDTTTPLLVVPALAAALVGGLTSFGLATVAGLAIGATQSLILGVAVDTGTPSLPGWLPITGLQQLVPVVVIVAVVWRRGGALPTRASLRTRSLPLTPAPRHPGWWVPAVAAVAVLLLATGNAGLRQAVIVTGGYALLTLSVVVVTGYSGQISLAQLAFAGVGGFSVIRLLEAQVPLIVAVLVAAGVATVLGVVVGLPATRVRGMTLAVATLAMAVAIEELVLRSTALSGGAAGIPAPRPSLFGLDVGVFAVGADNFRVAFGVFVVVVVALAYLVVANLRRGALGQRWVAVRGNERAAAAAGVNVGATKLSAFAVSAFLAGLSGVVVALSVPTLSPPSFAVLGALVAVALTYLSGVASLAGAVLAATLARGGLATAAVDTATGGGAGDYVFALTGVALVVVAIAAPDGVVGVVRRAAARVTAGRQSDEVAPGPPGEHPGAAVVARGGTQA